MGIFFGWIAFSLLVGAIGSSRNIGFAASFFLSLFLSPVIGLIITLFSPDKQKQEIIEQQRLTLQHQQEQEATKSTESKNIADQLTSLMELKNSGSINEDEFQKAKEKLLSN